MKFGNEMNAYPAHPILLHFPCLFYVLAIPDTITFPFLDVVERERTKETEKLVCVHSDHPWSLIHFFFSPSLFRSLRPHGLIEERAPWPCAGRQGFMPTRRKRTMNNKLPSTQEASLVLGFPRNQEIHTSKHFNGIFIKVRTNSTILM